MRTSLSVLYDAHVPKLDQCARNYLHLREETRPQIERGTLQSSFSHVDLVLNFMILYSAIFHA